MFRIFLYVKLATMSSETFMEPMDFILLTKAYFFKNFFMIFVHRRSIYESGSQFSFWSTLDTLVDRRFSYDFQNFCILKFHLWKVPCNYRTDLVEPSSV